MLLPALRVGTLVMYYGETIIDEFTAEDVGAIWSDYMGLDPDGMVIDEITIDEMMQRLLIDLQSE